MAIATVSVTGNIILPDNSIPRFADIVFTPTAAIASFSDAMIPAMVVSPIGAGGAINAQVVPNINAYQNTKYTITVIEYVSADKQVEARRHDLGTVRIAASTQIGVLIPVAINTRPYAPLVYRRGDTIAIGLQSLNDDGAREDLTGVTISSSLRSQCSGIVYPLTVDNIIPRQGLYRVYRASTSDLPEGNYDWNISFTTGSEKVSTAPREIRIARGLA